MELIRKVTPADAATVCAIYNHYVLNTAISLETEAVSETEMLRRINDIVGNGYSYFVFEAGGEVVGYCYLNSWKGRCAYRTTAEVTIYIDKEHTHRGIGSKLMGHLVDNIDRRHVHTLIAGISLPNEASAALCEKFGFRKISHFYEIGCKFGKWRDIGHWQLRMEDKTKILILCTGNSCRSQMAHGFLQSFDKKLIVCSAGTKAAGKLNERAVKAMAEVGIDISSHTSDPIEKYLAEAWDYVITVCGGANETCPMFTGNVKHRLHMGFDDPSDVEGTRECIEGEFRRVRDEIHRKFHRFYTDELMQKQPCSCGTNDFFNYE